MYLYIAEELASDSAYEDYLRLTGMEAFADVVFRERHSEVKNKLIRSQLDKYIKFEPIRDTWIGYTGNKSFIVKMKAIDGGYIPVTPNSFPLIVMESMFKDDPSTERSFLSYKNASIAANATNNKVAIAETELRLFLKLHPERYPNVDSLFEIPAKYKIQEVLTREQMEIIYNEEMGDGE